MNVRKWIRRFEGNTGGEEVDWEAPVEMPAAVRGPLARSLAVFQLGETGTGRTLRRYVEKVRGREEFAGYERALALFVAEENRHAALLARVVRRLDGDLLEKQWSNGLFRRVRKLINLEFQLQLLLTAELLAEAYYEILRRTVPDGPIRQCCARIVADEVGHTSFHAEFFGELQRMWAPGWQVLWRGQFQLVHRVTCAVVWMDHRSCFRALGVGHDEFGRLCARAMRTYLRRMERSRREAEGRCRETQPGWAARSR